MHDGCPGEFKDGKEIVDKLREMDMAKKFMFDVLKVSCRHCGSIPACGSR